MINLKREIKPSDTLSFIMLSMAGICLIILILGIIFAKEPLYFALGVLFGAVVSCIRILLLSRAINRAVDMEPAESKAYMTAQYSTRMLLAIAAVVAGAMLQEYISIIGLILGLIAMQPAVYLANIIYKMMGGEKLEFNSAKKADRYSR